MPTATHPYKDSQLSVTQRVSDLLGRMALPEKIAQMCSHWLILSADGNHRIRTDAFCQTATTDDIKEMLRLGIGQITRPLGTHPVDPKEGVRALNALQKFLVEETRLGVPAISHEECLVGLMVKGATLFPSALNYGSTWNPDLIEAVGQEIRKEAKQIGCHQGLAPVLDVSRDVRWGRTEETYGEDPFLASRMGVAAIEGLQGDSFLIGRHHVVATAKHFAVHGQPEGGTNTGPGNYSERILRENFLVPFQVAVEEAKVGSVMASYNEIDGIPSHVNRWLLNRVLREEWGFRGYVTSDGDGLQMLIQTHHVAGNKLDAAAQAIAAGVDYDLSDGSVYRTLIAQVKQGTVPESDVDRAVARVLATKFRLGLFDNPFVDPDYARRGIGRALLERCETEARTRGFTRFELMGTLPGVRLYQALGYRPGAMVHYPVASGVTIEFIPMSKEIEG